MSDILDNVDFDSVRAEVEEILKNSLDGLVQGAREDVQRYVFTISNDLVSAIRDGRDDLRQELLAQMGLLAEIHRIRLNREARATLGTVLEVAARVGRTLLQAAVAAI